MKSFDSPAAFASFLANVIATLPIAQKAGLNAAAEIIERDAKAKIGVYQDEEGPFEAWQPLAPATLYGGVSPEGHHFKGKVELGYAPPDNPLLRDGTLRSRITHDASPFQAAVGVKSEVVSPAYGDPVDIGDVAKWQELGTSRMPARSFLGGAAVHKGREAVTELAVEIVAHIAGQAVKAGF